MKTILYDLFYAQPGKKDKFHGGGEYIKTVFEHLIKTNDGSYSVKVFFDFDKFMDKWLLDLIDEQNVETYDVKNMQDIERILSYENYDIFYTGLANVYETIDLPKGVTKVGTIHGLRNLERKLDWNEKYYYNLKELCKLLVKQLFSKPNEKRLVRRMDRTLTKFDRLITVSAHTEYALRVWLNISNKIEIKRLYTPSKQSFIPTEEDEREASEIGKFILLIGAGRWEKNIVRAIEALEDLFDKGYILDTKVVICGNLPDKVAAKIKRKDKYILEGYVSQTKLEALYKYCDFFVFPTLNEGFGLPPLEAMRYAKTCAISAVCSLPELYKDSVYYFNPYDTAEIANRILQAYQEKISPKIIMNTYNRIRKKQLEDLNQIKDYILGFRINEK